jgi:asparagine synthase (glutamine-hydrolysing)
MCGIAGICGDGWTRAQLGAMVTSQRHRGPDDTGLHVFPPGRVGLGHNRLSVIDLSAAGRQPMTNRDGTVAVVFNGEIYNYLELRGELHDYPYRTRTDTEVLIAAYERWGEACVDRFIGMFTFLLWDARRDRLFAARDRFGVKPLHYAAGAAGSLLLSSEIKALHAAGVPALFDEKTWAAYLATGENEHASRTFWKGVHALPAGHALSWHDGTTRIWCWYDLADRSGPDFDCRPTAAVEEEYLSLLIDSVRLRFRSDVPVGINVSGGLDSSILLGLVHAAQGAASEVKAFTFVSGHPDYDELPWVQQMLAATRHPSIVCEVAPEEVPAVAERVQASEDEPFGGLPTIAYARLFERARSENVTVLLDGQGLDEQWAGYDYYAAATNGHNAGRLQGTNGPSVLPECLVPEFRRCVEPFEPPLRFSDSLRNLQHRDATRTKLPRALRFNDRASMRASRELREPFLDHRLFEVALRQPAERKVNNGVHKWLLRRIARRLLPTGIATAPKRSVQTPQREWLRGTLRGWANDCIETALGAFGGQWLDAAAVRRAWRRYGDGFGDNSFYVWQWINLGLIVQQQARRSPVPDELEATSRSLST